MSTINLPNLDIGSGDFKSQESMDNILNVLQKYRKEINFMLLNLDARNMPSIITKIEQKEEAILKQDTPPEHLEGRLWLDTSVTPNKLKRSTGSAWVEAGADTSLLATKSEVSQTADSVVMSFSQLQNLYGEDVVISQGNTIISKDGIKVTHTGLGGQYSEMRADGFVRKWRYGEAKYLNDIWVELYDEMGDDFGSSRPAPYRIYLPSSFSGRLNTKVFVIPYAFSMTKGRMYAMDDIGELVTYFRVDAVVSYDRATRAERKDLSANPPWVELDVFQRVEWDEQRGTSSSDSYTEYKGIEYAVIAIGG